MEENQVAEFSALAPKRVKLGIGQLLAVDNSPQWRRPQPNFLPRLQLLGPPGRDPPRTSRD